MDSPKYTYTLESIGPAIRVAIEHAKTNGWAIIREETCAPLRHCCCPLAALVIYNGEKPCLWTVGEVCNLLGISFEEGSSFVAGFDGSSIYTEDVDRAWYNLGMSFHQT